MTLFKAPGPSPQLFLFDDDVRSERNGRPKNSAQTRIRKRYTHETTLAIDSASLQKIPNAFPFYTTVEKSSREIGATRNSRFNLSSLRVPVTLISRVFIDCHGERKVFRVFYKLLESIARLPRCGYTFFQPWSAGILGTRFLTSDVISRDEEPGALI